MEDFRKQDRLMTMSDFSDLVLRAIEVANAFGPARVIVDNGLGSSTTRGGLKQRVDMLIAEGKNQLVPDTHTPTKKQGGADGA